MIAYETWNYIGSSLGAAVLVMLAVAVLGHFTS